MQYHIAFDGTTMVLTGCYGTRVPYTTCVIPLCCRIMGPSKYCSVALKQSIWGVVQPNCFRDLLRWKIECLKTKYHLVI